jgi:F420-non-reducing hydrogenase iron-sulfur subunit
VSTGTAPTAVIPEEDRAVFEPRIVAFLCNWCSYAGADKAGAAQLPYPPNIRSVRVMCSGRVDPQFILSAFEQGADGVLVLACHPGDCHYKEQNYRAVARHRLLIRLLEARGVDGRRCRFGFVSAAEAEEFAATARALTEELRHTTDRRNGESSWLRSRSTSGD